MSKSPGAARPGPILTKALLATAACGLLTAGLGCGAGAEVGAGATVRVYVSAPLCTAARRELARRGARAGSLWVRIACLQDAERNGGKLDLAMTGANARRATEDSTAVAYLELPGPEVSFSRPILQEAGIAVITHGSAPGAMVRIIAALEELGEESPREAVASTAGL